MKYTYNNPNLKDRRRELRHCQTEVEKRLWQRLRNKQFHGLKFFRQFSVGMYILDFYCPKLKLAVELDGGHHAEDEIREYDNLRTEYLRIHEIEVIRFWNNDVIRNVEGVLQEIEKKITPYWSPLA